MKLYHLDINTLPKDKWVYVEFYYRSSEGILPIQELQKKGFIDDFVIWENLSKHTIYRKKKKWWQFWK